MAYTTLVSEAQWNDALRTYYDERTWYAETPAGERYITQDNGRTFTELADTDMPATMTAMELGDYSRIPEDALTAPERELAEIY